MRTELYSVRSSREEVTFISQHIKELGFTLDSEASARILFKTEVNSNPKKIKKEFLNSVSIDNPPELFIYVNALDTKDSSSFRRLFTPLITLAEKEFSDDEPKLTKEHELHISVLPVWVEGQDYPGYCFRLQTETVVVLPALRYIKGDYISFVAKATALALTLIEEDRKENPKGYIIVGKEALENRQEADGTAEFRTREMSEEATEENALSEEKEEPKITEDSREISADRDKKKKKKFSPKSFIMSFIPHKGDTVKSIVLKIIVLVAMVTFMVSAYMLLDFFVISPAINKADITDIQNIFYQAVTNPDSSDDSTGTAETTGKNWEGLKKINDEIVGWVKIDNTKIDYPVLWHKGDSPDSQYYLYRNYKEKPSDFGSIFVDYRCVDGTENRHVILHGHNMGSDNSMFAQLTKYPGNLKFYQSHPIVHFDTPTLEGDWIIYSVMKINVSNTNDEIFNYLMGEFESDAQYMNFIYNQKVRSYLNVDVPINENDRILTLSTCSYEADNMRTVVVARQLREGENYEKYVKKAETQYPASKAYSTFSAELERKNITWYDGKGKLEGSEDIPYMAQAITYTVKFYDGNGKVLLTQQVIKGKDATPPKEAPRKTASNGYYYVFQKWDTSYKNVQKNLNVKPIFKKVAMPAVQETTWKTDPPEQYTPIIPDTPNIPDTPVVPEVTDRPETTTRPPATEVTASP
ncbi:MAG: class B sortase [Eubacteriales bacterium]|nr:class B sortase [Eubacteriales bacterium]